MALKQSHVNQLQKIIAAAEKLIVDLEREVESSQGGNGRGGRTGRGGKKDEGRSGRGRSTGRASGGEKAARGRSGNAGRKTGGRKAAEGRSGATSRNTGTRRNRAQTAEFRQSILRELEGGTPVADLAAKHGITPAYVYQIKSRAEA